MKNTKRSLGSLIKLAGVAALFAAHTVWAQAPSVVSVPLSQAVPEGGSAILTISVSGSLPITYTWHRNFEIFTPFYEVTLDSTNCTLVLTNLTTDDAGFYSVQAQNAEGYGPGVQTAIAVISSGMATNGFVLTVRGLTNSVWTVNCATNLPPTWFNLTNFSIPKSPSVFTFTDLEATNLNRFYQVIPIVY